MKPMRVDGDRVGLYIRPETRDKLNLFKAMLVLKLGRTLSQDEAISYLLERYGAEELQGQAVRHA